MQNNCTLDEQIRYCNQKCEHCGWNPVEAKRRERMVADNKFTTCKGGIKKLIIKREENEE